MAKQKPKPHGDYFDQECGTRPATRADVDAGRADEVGEDIVVCPECGSANNGLESGDHGNECYDCGARFCCP